MIQITINLRAVLIGFFLLLAAVGVATPFAISLADDGPSDDRVSEQRINTPLGTAFTYQGRLDTGGAPANGSFDQRRCLQQARLGRLYPSATPLVLVEGR